MKSGRWIRHAAMAAIMPALLACSQSGAYVDFAQPKDGAELGRTFKVVMQVHGMQVHKAGELIEGTGHHHLIIDGGFIPRGETVPKDATHLHFGKGQTETMLTLNPGEHTLTLQFADGHHQSYGKALSKTIHVHVK